MAVKRYTANITRWTVPCITVVRPVPKDNEATNSDSTSNTVDFASMPNERVQPVISDDDGDGRDGQSNAGQRRAERQIETGLQSIGPCRLVSGNAFRQQDDRSDDDAHKGLGRPHARHGNVQSRRQCFGQQHHGTQASQQQRRTQDGQLLGGRGA